MAATADLRPPSPAGPARGLRLAVVVRPGDALGFRLAGAPVDEVAPGDALAVLRRLLADPAVGVVAIDEALLAAVPAHVVQRARARGLPVLLPFAIPRRRADAGRGRDYVAALIRRAIGYAVKLGGAREEGGAP